ncbi:P2Y purinoceptor 11 [Tiliqua scincoides]|uniref:P2Y purinoceptor 11 n=1 Tax=Tiliqua scincoides TaxID=71010 RepID=UPI003461D27F
MSPQRFLEHENMSESFQNQIWFIPILQFILAVAGNVFAIYRFVAYERTWHSGIIYTFNLTISNLLYALSLVPLALYYKQPKTWTFGLPLCKLDRFLFFCNLYGSTFFVACISLNRYVAIVHPFFSHGYMEPRHAKLLSGLVWLLVVAISTPVLKFSTLDYDRSTNTTVQLCVGSAVKEQLANYWPYSLFLMGFGCGLPFILTSVSCGAILHTVLRNCNITKVEKRKVKTLIGVVVTLYAIFYFPYHILRNLNLHYRMQSTNKMNESESSRVVPVLYQLAKLLVQFHICIHPFVYAALADSIQETCHCQCRQGKDRQERDVELKLHKDSSRTGTNATSA